MSHAYNTDYILFTQKYFTVMYVSNNDLYELKPSLQSGHIE